MKTDLKVRVETDAPTGRILAVYCRIRKGEVAKTKEIAAGLVYADYGHRDQLLGFEILGPCQITLLDSITKKEPDEVRSFLHKEIPDNFKISA